MFAEGSLDEVQTAVAIHCSLRAEIKGRFSLFSFLMSKYLLRLKIARLIRVQEPDRRAMSH